MHACEQTECEGNTEGLEEAVLGTPGSFMGKDEIGIFYNIIYKNTVKMIKI